MFPRIAPSIAPKTRLSFSSYREVGPQDLLERVLLGRLSNV